MDQSADLSGAPPDLAADDALAPAGTASLLERVRGAMAATPQADRPDARESDPLLQFGSESTPAPAAARPERRPAPARPAGQAWSRYRYAAVAAGAVLLLGVVSMPLGRAIASRQLVGGWFQRPAPTATLTVQTRPSGAEVLIDGRPSGVSPVTLSVAAGAHNISARLGKAERVMPFTFAAGAQVVQLLEIEQPADVNAAQQTRMSVITDPPGARVEIDGSVRGRSPVFVSDLIAGAHRVSVVGETGSAERTVVTSPESSLSVVFTLSSAHAQPADGWAVIQAPFDVQLLEHNDVIGTSGTKIMMTAGTHQIAVRNVQLGYEDSRRVVIAPGKTVSVAITAPTAPVSVNARPWADVTIDGQAVGQTPLANVSIGIGPHQVVFRHPQFGERRQNIVVTLKGPNRIAVDFTKRS